MTSPHPLPLPGSPDSGAATSQNSDRDQKFDTETLAAAFRNPQALARLDAAIARLSTPVKRRAQSPENIDH